MKTIWYTSGEYVDKRRAKRLARELRAPGKDRVKARITKKIYWKVEYADLKGGVL